jgi:Ca-activated chloride channel family protein
MKKLIFIILLLTFVSLSYATGLMLPTNKNYPKDFLRIRSSDVTVIINGLTAETIVSQEFQNEWSDSTDAVYSFPLPEDARATDIIYWYNDVAYKAVLKVGEQSTNPGTGEGGVAALVNTYIGKNGIKIQLKGIKAGKTQKVELHYISACDYYKGKVTYNFPLNTSDFVTYPLDNIKFNITINSSTDISGFDIPALPGYKKSQEVPKTLKVELNKSKFYLDQDFSFYYTTGIAETGYDLYSNACDTADGHFVLYIRPQDTPPADSVLRKNMIFLFSNDSYMSGNIFTSTINAISSSLDRLSPKDFFNIAYFNYNVGFWQPAPVAATAANIAAAKNYIGQINISSGSDMNAAIKRCLEQFTDTTANNAMLVFTANSSNPDPRQIESLNLKMKTGIFINAIGSISSRARLEMTAGLNYGFVTYIKTDENITAKMLRVMYQISSPLLKSAVYEFSRQNISEVVPAKLPTTYAGSAFFMAGRYKTPGKSPMSIAGYTASGFSAFDVMLDFSSSAGNYKFAESIWAKENIDALERQIEVYGETPELKAKLINLSLAYNIRCRYTAYIADYKTLPSAVKNGEGITVSSSYISGNYPNPFNPVTKIRFYLDKSAAGKEKFLRIYNILGQLVGVIDISGFTEGWHESVFNAKNCNGSQLPSGIYFVRLQIGERIVSAIKVNLVK